MKENHQPYDLDLIDPIAVKEHRSAWSFIVPASLGVVALWFLIGPIRLSPYRKGNWLGEQGMFFGLDEILFGGLFAFISLLVCIFCKREKLGIVSMPIYVLVFFGQFWLVPKTAVTEPTYRFKSEVVDYKQALSSNSVFGDQFSEQMNGRKLTYWRWGHWGIDNSVGVIYDPKDQYNEEDSWAFRKQTSGRISKIRKMEPHWYIVWTT